MNLELRLSEWCDGKIGTQDLKLHLASALEALSEHRNGLENTLASLDDPELFHCYALEQSCKAWMNRLEALLVKLGETAEEAELSRFISLSDQVSRIRFQLNQALWEFKNQVLITKGPTEIPSLNLLYSLKQDFEANPTAQERERFLMVIDSEIALARRGVRDLERETASSDSKDALCRTFIEHIEHLQCLGRELNSSLERTPDLFGHLLQLNLTYTEINKLYPVVTSELADCGETKFPMLNRVLTILDAVADGKAGEQSLLGALEGFEVFLQSLDTGIENLSDEMLDDAPMDDLDRALESFSDGANLVYDFLERRDPQLLKKARLCFVQFANTLTACEEELEEIQNKNASSKTRTTVLMTERLSKVYQAVDDILLRRIERGAYLDVLREFETHLQGMADSPAARQVKETLQMMVDGVESLSRFAQEPHEEFLTEGVSKLNRGALALHNVLN